MKEEVGGQWNQNTEQTQSLDHTERPCASSCLRKHNDEPKQKPARKMDKSRLLVHSPGSTVSTVGAVHRCGLPLTLQVAPDTTLAASKAEVPSLTSDRKWTAEGKN